MVILLEIFWISSKTCGTIIFRTVCLTLRYLLNASPYIVVGYFWDS